MRISIILISFCFFTQIFGQNNENMSLKLSDLEGKWFINQSDFPMWLKGDKTFPTFNYELGKNKKGIFLYDKVSYIKNGKTKSIKGKDKSLNSANTAFVWRGNGILKLIKSHWKILYINTTDQWAIIYFEKTLFTPSGYDVISRDKINTSEIENDIMNKLKELNISEKLTLINQTNE